VPDAAAKLRTQSTFWAMKQTTIMERGQRRCRHRRGALEGL